MPDQVIGRICKQMESCAVQAYTLKAGGESYSLTGASSNQFYCLRE